MKLKDLISSNYELPNQILKDSNGEYLIVTKRTIKGTDYLEGVYLNHQVIRCKFQRVQDCLNDEYVGMHIPKIAKTSKRIPNSQDTPF